ncbi:MAG: hypothetical protein DRH37_09500 [Deltaproteobacteria bacterium]|nr:MAG: hypothetical protein DRH37_09500 [Deltaproteobacteria bacterium]
MDISAVMNLHELAMTKHIRQQSHLQARQEKLNIQIQAQEAGRSEKSGARASLEAYPGVFTHTVRRQKDPKAVTARVKRQADAQSAKETVQGTAEEMRREGDSQESGSVIDIVT